MKKVIFVLLCVFVLVANSKSAFAAAFVTLNDTIVFDLSQAQFSSNGGTSYIEFPVVLNTIDPEVNAVDFWFQFNLDKLTYVSTTSVIPTLDVFSNFNSNNLYLSNTSSTTSISVFLPMQVTIMKLKFSLTDPCVSINEDDFFSSNALLNGVVSNANFITPDAPAEIEILSTDPLCQNSDVEFSYSSDYAGHVITSYDWDFGNATNGIGQTTNATYSESGSFPVALVVTTEEGCEYTLNSSAIIEPSPVVDFTSSFDPDANLVSFTNLTTISNGTVLDFVWDFGDGNNANEFEPTHTYAADGFYDVTLTATSDLGCSSSVTIETDASVGLDEFQFEKNLMNLYPNPADEMCSIHSVTGICFYVVDQLGQIVLTNQCIGANQIYSFEVGQFSEGIYSIVGNSNGQIISKQFVIQH